MIFGSYSYMQMYKVKEPDVKQMQTTKAHCQNCLSCWGVKDEIRHPTAREDSYLVHWKQQHLFFYFSNPCQMAACEQAVAGSGVDL